MQENISKEGVSRHRDILVALGLGLFSVLLYFCSYSFEFTFDDLDHIQTNELIKEFSLKEIFSSPTWPGNLYRPAFTSSLALAYQVSELDPAFYHLGNILQNAFSVMAVYFLINILFGFRLAFAAALLFACHPIHVEAVANISHRSEVMAALFGLLGAICCLKRFNLFAVFFLFISFCCKESAASFLLLVPLAIWVKDSKAKLDVRLIFTLLLPYSAYLLLRYNALGALFSSGEKVFYVVNPLAELSFFERLPSALSNLGYYLVNLISPFFLSPDYSFSYLGPIDLSSPKVGLNLLVLALFLVILLFGFFKKRSILVFFTLWFFFSFVVTANIVVPIGTIFADRLAYLPSLSICGLMAFALLRIEHEFLRTSLLGIIAVLFSVQSLELQKIWKSNETLYSYAIEVVPESAKTQQNYAIVCLNQGRWDDAALHFAQALEIYPKYADVAYRMSFVYREKGMPRGVEHWIRKALEINPNHGPAKRALSELERELNANSAGASVN